MTDPVQKSGRTAAELLDRYGLYARAAGFSSSQIHHVRSCVGLLDRFLGGIRDMREVTVADFRSFLANLRDRPAWLGLKNVQARRLSGTSINTYARAIKAFFNWLNVEGIITNNALVTVPVPRKPKTLPKVFSETEMRAVCTSVAANVRDAAIFYVFLDTGLRLSELSRLIIGNIDTQAGTIKTLGKGNKERFVYLTTDAAKYVDSYIEQFRLGAAKSEFLFLNEDGLPLQARGVQALLLRLGKKAGLVERLSAHKLRHTFATLSLKYGGNLEYIRKILGHSDIKTTSEAYLNVLDADVSAAHQRFSPLSNLQQTVTGKEGYVTPNEGRSRAPAPAVTPIMSPEQRAYLDTPHKQQIRQLAEELTKEISLPWIKDCLIADFQPGRPILGKEGYLLRIPKNGELSFIEENETELFRHALLEHLHTAGLTKVLSDILSWNEGVEDSLKECHELLKRARRMIEDIHRTTIPFKDDGNPGFTMDFPILICADALQQNMGSAHFKAFPYRVEGTILRFGAYAIYNGVLNEDLKPFEEYHRKLRSECVKWKQTRVIAKHWSDLEDLAMTINKQLRKFMAMELLPGHCELCY